MITGATTAGRQQQRDVPEEHPLRLAKPNRATRFYVFRGTTYASRQWTQAQPPSDS